MTRRLARSSWALALPLALTLSTPFARADEAKAETKDKSPSRTVKTTKNGNTVTREATVTQADGSVRKSIDNWTHEGNTVKHDGQTTFADGKTETRQSTTTKDGDTVTRDTIRVGSNGGKTEAHSVRTKQGDSVTTQTTRTHTGPDDARHRKHRRHRAHAGAEGHQQNAPKQ